MYRYRRWILALIILATMAAGCAEANMVGPEEVMSEELVLPHFRSNFLHTVSVTDEFFWGNSLSVVAPAGVIPEVVFSASSDAVALSPAEPSLYYCDGCTHPYSWEFWVSVRGAREGEAVVTATLVGTKQQSSFRVRVIPPF